MGPLPRLHRLLIAAILLSLCLAAGIWLASSVVLPLGGVGVGLASGMLLVWLSLHDFSRDRERPVRVPRRR